MTRETLAARGLLAVGCLLTGVGGVAIYAARLVLQIDHAEDRVRRGRYDGSGVRRDG